MLYRLCSHRQGFNDQHEEPEEWKRGPRRLETLEEMQEEHIVQLGMLAETRHEARLLTLELSERGRENRPIKPTAKWVVVTFLSCTKSWNSCVPC